MVRVEEGIELIVDGMIHRKFLNPRNVPEIEFEIPEGRKVLGGRCVMSMVYA